MCWDEFIAVHVAVSLREILDGFFRKFKAATKQKLLLLFSLLSIRGSLGFFVGL